MVDRRRLYPFVPYRITKTHGRPVIEERGKRYRKVKETKGTVGATATAYERALAERARRGKGNVIWTGEPTGKGRERYYGVYVKVKAHRRRTR